MAPTPGFSPSALRAPLPLGGRGGPFSPPRSQGAGGQQWPRAIPPPPPLCPPSQMASQPSASPSSHPSAPAPLGAPRRQGVSQAPGGSSKQPGRPRPPGLSGPRPASGSLLGRLTQEHSPVPWAGGSQSGPGKLGLSSAPSAVLCSPLPWGSPSLHRQFWRACQPAHQGAGWVRVLGKGGQTPRTASGHCWWLPPRPPSWKRDLRGAGVGGPRPWLEHLERLHPRGPANGLSSEVSAGWVAAPCALDSPRPRQVPPGLSDVTRHRQPTRVGLSSGT